MTVESRVQSIITEVKHRLMPEEKQSPQPLQTPEQKATARRNFLKALPLVLGGAAEAVDMLGSVIKYGDINHTVTGKIMDSVTGKIKSGIDGQGDESTTTSTPMPTKTATPPAPTNTPIPEPTATPESKAVDYGIHTPEDARTKGVIPESALTDGSLLAFLRTISQLFDPKQIKLDLPFQEVFGLGGATIVYDTKTAPHFKKDGSDAPFRRNTTAYWVEASEADKAEVKFGKYNLTGYLIMPIEYADPSDPGNKDKNIWAIGVVPMSTAPGSEQEIIKSWRNNLRIAPIQESNSDWGTGQEMPLVKRAWEKTGTPDFKALLGENIPGTSLFADGDPRVLDGKIVLLHIPGNYVKWYTMAPDNLDSDTLI